MSFEPELLKTQEEFVQWIVVELNALLEQCNVSESGFRTMTGWDESYVKRLLDGSDGLETVTVRELVEAFHILGRTVRLTTEREGEA